MALLEVEGLRTTFTTDDGPLTAVDGVSFSVDRGRVLGIVGESGCGKSVTSLSIMGLLDRRASRIEGSIRLGDKELVGMGESGLRRLRGQEMAMIFQDPMTSLNPLHTIGRQLEEAVLLHQDVSSAQARTRAGDMLAAVGIPNARERLKSYPHEFSGGMRQRVMIAMALANDPALLIADEPTTALDVTTQAQILDLMRRLRSEFGSAIIMITHDLGVVAEICDEVIVMYAGRVVEQGPVDEIFERPQHPYTWGLLGSLPGRQIGTGRLYSIPGTPPSLLDPPSGCRFNPRCAFAMDACRQDPPPALEGRRDLDVHRFACRLDEATRAREGSLHAGEAVAPVAEAGA